MGRAMGRALNGQAVSFEDENRYETLRDMENTTDMTKYLDTLAGKRKPTSPALDETTTKTLYPSNLSYLTALLENDDDLIIPSESVSGQNMPNVHTYMYTGDNEGASSSCVNAA